MRWRQALSTGGPGLESVRSPPVSVNRVVACRATHPIAGQQPTTAIAPEAVRTRRGHARESLRESRESSPASAAVGSSTQLCVCRVCIVKVPGSSPFQGYSASKIRKGDSVAPKRALGVCVCVCHGAARRRRRIHGRQRLTRRLD